MRNKALDTARALRKVKKAGEQSALFYSAVDCINRERVRFSDKRKARWGRAAQRREAPHAA